MSHSRRDRVPASLAWAKNAQEATPAEIVGLLKAASVGDSRAADKLVLGFAGAILRISYKYANGDLEELFSEGLLAAYRRITAPDYIVTADEDIFTAICASAKWAIANTARKNRLTASRLDFKTLDSTLPDDHEGGNQIPMLLRDVIADDTSLPADLILELNEDLTIIKKAAATAMTTCSKDAATVIKELYLNDSNKDIIFNRPSRPNDASGRKNEAAMAARLHMSRPKFYQAKMEGLLEIRMALGLPLPEKLPKRWAAHSRYRNYRPRTAR